MHGSLSQCEVRNKANLSQTVATQHANLENYYHGAEGNIAFVERFLSGSDQFAALFTRKSSGSELTLEIKKVLTGQKTTYTVGTGKNDDLTLVLLSAKSMSSSGEKLVGKSVKYYAEMVQRNAKKALAFTHALLVNGQMPSGKTFPDDFAEYLLDKMFRDEPKNKGNTRPLHHDSNGRIDAGEAEFLKGQKEDALDLVNIELNSLKYDPSGDLTNLNAAKKAYSIAVKNWTDFSSGIYANKEKIDVDVDYINAFMRKEKSAAVDLTGLKSDEEEEGEKEGEKATASPETTGSPPNNAPGSANPVAEQENATESDVDDNNDFLYTTPGVMGKVNGKVVNTSMSYRSELTDVVETPPMFAPLDLIPDQVKVVRGGRSVRDESQITMEL